MSSSYTGNPAGATEGVATQLTLPADTEAANVASINPALQKLADAAALLLTKAGFIDAGNTWTQAQVIQALLTLSAAGAVSLSRSGDQTILKGGTGKLQVGTSIAGDLELLVNGVAKAILRNSDGKLAAVAGFDAGSQRIVNVTDPASAQDAATKAYVDGTLDTPTAGTGWTLSQVYVRRCGGIVTMKACATANSVSASFGSILTLGSNFRPLATVSYGAVFFGLLFRIGVGGYYAQMFATYLGQVGIGGYLSGSSGTMSDTSLPTPAVGDTVQWTATFPGS